MKKIINTMGPSPNIEKMDVLAVETNFNQQLKETTTNGTSRMTIKVEWLDYIALNTALERGRKNVSKLLLDSNCRVNCLLDVPSNTPLHNAVLLEDINLVDCLLSRGASIVAVNYEGDTALHLAFIRRQTKLVDLMLSFIEKISIYVNPKNSQGLTHLHIASTRKNTELIKNFLQAGANSQDSINSDSFLWPGFTALHFAIEFGSLQAIQVLKKTMTESANDRNCQTAVQLAYQKVKNISIMVHMLSAENHYLNFGYFTYPSYFHFACMRDDPKVVEEFIKSGADVNTPISRDAVFCASYSPLHFAVESNCMENVKLLLEHGAIAEHRNNDNMTPLHLAMYHENFNKDKYTIVDYLYTALEDKGVYLKDNCGMSYLHIACTRNDVEIIKKFLDNHHDVNARIQHNPRKFSNYTPLHFAVLYQCFESVQLLIERGANVNINISGSGTPLHLACELGYADIIDLLLKSGALATAIRAKGQKTTLHLLVESYMNRENGASTENKLELLPFVKKFVELGVNINARDKFYFTALHMACLKLVDGSQIVKKLLDAGANINFENIDGQTPPEMTLFQNYCGNAEDYMMLYHHLQNLKILGYKVILKNEGYCEMVLKRKDVWDPEHKDFKNKKIARKREQRLVEIAKLRSVRLQNPARTLYDFLTYDPKNLNIFAYDQVVKKIMEEKGLKKEYPVFANFLKFRYEKALTTGWNTKKVGKPRQFKRPRLR